jgi:hypothetical protein
MLSPARVLVADGIENLSPAEQRQLARNLRAAPGTLVILIASSRGRRPGDRGDRGDHLSRELMSAVSQAGSVVECRAPTREEAVAWVTAEARALGSVIKPAAAVLLVERVGADLGRLSREIEKLSLCSRTPGQISRQDIEEATPRTPQDNIFALGDAIGGGDGDDVVVGVLQGVEPFVQRGVGVGPFNPVIQYPMTRAVPVRSTRFQSNPKIEKCPFLQLCNKFILNFTVNKKKKRKRIKKRKKKNLRCKSLILIRDLLIKL